MAISKRPAEGPTTRKHYARGYQAAMLDLLRAWNEGGPERAAQWMKDNTRPETRAEFDAQPTFDVL